MLEGVKIKVERRKGRENYDLIVVETVIFKESMHNRTS